MLSSYKGHIKDVLNTLTRLFQLSVNLNLKSLILLVDMISLSMLSLDQTVDKLTYFMKLLLLWFKVLWMDLMEQYLLMDRPVLENLLLWKVNAEMKICLDWFQELLIIFFTKSNNLMEILNSQLNAVILKFIWKKLWIYLILKKQIFKSKKTKSKAYMFKMLLKYL